METFKYNLQPDYVDGISRDLGAKLFSRVECYEGLALSRRKGTDCNTSPGRNELLLLIATPIGPCSDSGYLFCQAIEVDIKTDTLFRSVFDIEGDCVDLPLYHREFEGRKFLSNGMHFYKWFKYGFNVVKYYRDKCCKKDW